MPLQILHTGGKILNVASADLGSADTSYTYLLLTADRQSKGGFSLDWTLVATTLTFEFSNDVLPAGVHFNDATAAQLAALEWHDLTLALTGAATQTTSGSLTSDENFAWRFGRVKRLTTNATNSLAIWFNRN